MHFPYGVEITVQRQSGTDRNGNPLPPTTHTITDCAHCPRNTLELEEGGRDTVLSGEWLFGQSDADLLPQDRVWLPRDDLTKSPPWFVDGEVQLYVDHPFTSDPDAQGFQAVLTKVQG